MGGAGPACRDETSMDPANPAGKSVQHILSRIVTCCMVNRILWPEINTVLIMIAGHIHMFWTFSLNNTHAYYTCLAHMHVELV